MSDDIVKLESMFHSSQLAVSFYAMLKEISKPQRTYKTQVVVVLNQLKFCLLVPTQKSAPNEKYVVVQKRFDGQE